MTNYIKSIIAPMMFSVPMSAYTPEVSKKPEVYEQQQKNLDELMQGRPQSEKDKIINSWVEKNMEKRAVEIQSSVDSVAYRRLFDGTELAKDSDAVAEFNKIKKASIPESYWGFPSYLNRMDEILKTHGITQDEIYKFQGQHNIGRETYPGGCTMFTTRDNRVVIARHQFTVDSVAYQRFFEKHNMVNKNVLNGIKNISKKIKPMM